MADLSADQVTAIAAFGAALAAGVGVWRADRNTQRSIQAVETPFLIPDHDQLESWVMPWEGGTEGRPFRLKTPLVNVGRGPALMGDVRLTIGDVDVLDAAGGQIAIRAASSSLYFLNALGEPPPQGKEGLMRIYYTSAPGERFMTRIQFKTATQGIHCTSYLRAVSDGGERSFLFQSEPQQAGNFLQRLTRRHSPL